MFELKLVDIFSTLCVGFITVFLSIYIYFLFTKLFVAKKFDDDFFSKWGLDLLKTNFKDTGYAIVSIILVYFFGIIASDLTGRMTDSDDHKASVFNYLKSCTFMEQESYLRKEALFNIHTDSSITLLGKNVLLNRKIVNEANEAAGTSFFLNDTTHNADSLKLSWNRLREILKKEKMKDKSFTGFVLQIYYTSKNWVFSKDGEPLHELKDIQNRIDLSRSIVLIIAFSLHIILAMCIVFVIYFFSLKIFYHHAPKFYLPLTACVLLISLLAICRECYHIGEMNYLKRAFGYYVSSISEKKEIKSLETVVSNTQ